MIKVGAATEVELKEKKHRIEDAVQSTKAAVEEGIVPGGGVALLNAQGALDKVDLEGDELTGAMIVRRALEEPIKQIAQNAGLEGGVVVEKVRALDQGEGLNAATGEYGDMFKFGVVDPAKVTRSALQNAASIAALFLTTEAVVAEKPEKAPAMPAAAACPAVTWTSDPVTYQTIHERGLRAPFRVSGLTRRVGGRVCRLQEALPPSARAIRRPGNGPQRRGGPKNRGLRRALLAFAVFRPSESAQWIAILVFAYGVGGTREMGIAAVALLVPTALLAPFVSQLGDRIHRERALALGYLAIGVAAGLVAAALALSLPNAVVYLFAAVVNICISMARPTHLSILPELAETPAQLTAANALTSTLEGFAIFAGPLLAGLLIAVDGPKLVFAVSAVMMLAVGFLVLAVHARTRMTEHHVAVGDALEGFRELRRRPGARLLLGFVAGQTVVIGALDVLTVVLAYGVLSMGPSGPGVLSAAVGVGGLVGAAATVTLIGRERLAPRFFLGVFAIGPPIAWSRLRVAPRRRSSCWGSRGSERASSM